MLGFASIPSEPQPVCSPCPGDALNGHEPLYATAAQHIVILTPPACTTLPRAIFNARQSCMRRCILLIIRLLNNFTKELQVSFQFQSIFHYLTADRLSLSAPFQTHHFSTTSSPLVRTTSISFSPCLRVIPLPPAVPVLRARLHSCAPPSPQNSTMQQCSLSSPAMPILNAILTSPLNPYTTQLMVFATSMASLFPPFASPDGNAAATVRIGHSTCDIVTASDAIPHADLNDFGIGGGFLQVLRLKSVIPADMMSTSQHSVSDVALSAAGAVLTTSSNAIAQLLKVNRRKMTFFSFNSLL